MAWLRMAVLAAAVLGASAYNRPETTKDFKSLDLDESGHVDRAEVDAHLDKQFDVRAQQCASRAATRVRPAAHAPASLLSRAPCKALRRIARRRRRLQVLTLRRARR